MKPIRSDASKTGPIPHIHKDTIIAWANGAEIQFNRLGYSCSWFDIANPSWDKDCLYRVKHKLVDKYLVAFKMVDKWLISESYYENIDEFHSRNPLSVITFAELILSSKKQFEEKV